MGVINKAKISTHCHTALAAGPKDRLGSGYQVLVDECPHDN